MHDLTTSCYSLCVPCLVREKKKEGGGEKQKKGIISLTFVLFCLQGIKIVLPCANGWEFQLGELYILHWAKTLTCS